MTDQADLAHELLGLAVGFHAQQAAEKALKAPPNVGSSDTDLDPTGT